MKPSEWTKHFVVIRHRKVPYSLKTVFEGKIHLKCEEADINQQMDFQQLGKAVSDLPRRIEETRKKEQDREKPRVMRFLVSAEDKELIEQTSDDQGYGSVSD